jgi:negative regulator of sigma E activity
LSVSAQTTVLDCEAATESEQALAKLLNAHSAISYEGTVLFERADDRQFLEVAWPEQNAPNELRQGTLRRLNAKVDPQAEFWPSVFVPKDRVCDLSKFYSMSLESSRVIAGRSTRRLVLRPRDTLRLAHLVDVDIQTGMALAMVTAEPGGNVLERFEFAAIRYREVPALETSVADDALIGRGRGVIPGYFVVAENHEQGMFVVSDGWATASVFIEPLSPTAPAGEGAVIDGATLTYTRGTRVGSNGVLISVLGEVPVVTARLLADAVRSAGPGS